MLTNGMFWKRFYFVVILISCSCFLLCSDGACEPVKRFFGCGQPETSMLDDSGYWQDNSIHDNNSSCNNDNSLYNNKNNNNSGNGTYFDFEKNNIQNDENKILFSENNVSGENNISDLKFVFLSTTTSVGKTSILNYLLGKGFDKNCSPTIGFEFLGVPYRNESDNMGKQIELWDTSGNEVKRKLTTGSFCNADAIIFVYDITDDKSFNSLGDYISQVKNVAESTAKGCLFFLLGNKLDLVEENEETRQVKKEEAIKLAVDKQLIFLGECSAKNNTYEPAKKLPYKKVVLRNGECTGGLSDMLNYIIHYIRDKTKIKVKKNM